MQKGQLSGGYQRLFDAYKVRRIRPEAGVELCMDREADLFNDTLHDYLMSLQSLGKSAELEDIAPILQKIRREVAEFTSFNISPRRFSTADMWRQMREMEIIALPGERTEHFDRFRITAKLNYKGLSVVEREFVARAFSGYVDTEYGAVVWEVADLKISRPMTEYDVSTWISEEYKAWCWAKFQGVLAERREKFYPPLRVAVYLWLVKMGLYRRPVWTLNEG